MNHVTWTHGLMRWIGDYAHELWMDEHLDVIYINEKVVPEEWTTYEVGHTRFNDEALRQAGKSILLFRSLQNRCWIAADSVMYSHQFT